MRFYERGHPLYVDNQIQFLKDLKTWIEKELSLSGKKQKINSKPPEELSRRFHLVCLDGILYSAKGGYKYASRNWKWTLEQLLNFARKKREPRRKREFELKIKDKMIKINGSDILK